MGKSSRIASRGNRESSPQPAEIALRIPGEWAHPGELVERLPPEVSLTSDGLRLADGTVIEVVPMPADDQFFQVFQTACRRPAQPEELAVIRRYTVNIALLGPAGSLDAAHTMLRAGAAIIAAGGAGVFIDNSALAHGGQDWLEMAEDGGPDAISYAFTSIARGREGYFTVGMQTMGLPDLSMPAGGNGDEGDALIEIVRFLSSGGSMEVGDMIMHDAESDFQIVGRGSDNFRPGSPMHNPRGRLKIMSRRGIGESN